jgi:NADH-quinone oxidoreductase subunit N
MNGFEGFLPFWITAAGAVLLLFLEAAFRNKGRRVLPGFCAAVCVAALAADVRLLSDPNGSPGPFFSGAIHVDKLSLFAAAVVLVSALLSASFSAAYLRREKAVTGEYYALLLFAASGGILMAAAAETLTLFVGLELLSIPAYVLAGSMRVKGASVEASLKYFLPGAFASALFLYGAALLYGATGSTSLESLRAMPGPLVLQSSLLFPGVALLLGALAFKVAVAPFHAWAPDVYEGAPAPAAAFLSTGVKAAAFTVLLRLFADILGGPGATGPWAGILAALALLTMTLGNLGALVQTSVKRMLAYSSVAHAGYILVGFSVVGTAPTADVERAVAFYLMAYTFMTAGAFGWLAHAAGGAEKALAFSDFDGYASKRPGAALAMTVFLFALAGMPPTAGFFGKYLVFKLAVDHGLAPLALAAVFFSLVSFAYYLKLAVSMYMRPPAAPGSASDKEPLTYQAALVLCVIGVLMLGFYRIPF